MSLPKQEIYEEYRERYLNGELGVQSRIAEERGVSRVTIGQIIGEMRPGASSFTEAEEFLRVIAKMR